MRIPIISDIHGNCIALDAVLEDLHHEPTDQLTYYGSPRSFDDAILPTTTDKEVRRFLDPRDDVIYTGGHTHMQFVRHLGRTFHFNPDSVGLAYRHDQPDDQFSCDPWAEYAG